jgi:hypothetical protein
MTSRAPSSAGRAGPRTAGEMGTPSAFIASLIAPMVGSSLPRLRRTAYRSANAASSISCHCVGWRRSILFTTALRVASNCQSATWWFAQSAGAKAYSSRSNVSNRSRLGRFVVFANIIQAFCEWLVRPHAGLSGKVDCQLRRKFVVDASCCPRSSGTDLSAGCVAAPHPALATLLRQPHMFSLPLFVR